MRTRLSLQLVCVAGVFAGGKVFSSDTEVPDWLQVGEKVVCSEWTHELTSVSPTPFRPHATMISRSAVGQDLESPTIHVCNIVEKNRVIPVGDRFFRVVDFVQGTDTKSPEARMRLEALDRKEAEVTKECVAISIVSIATVGDQVVSILRMMDADDGKAPRALIATWPLAQEKLEFKDRDLKLNRKVEVTEGDSIRIGRLEHRIVKIVPTDSHKRLTGWIEIARRGRIP